jgi:peptide/nickel transport system substrate-binding protein
MGYDNQPIGTGPYRFKARRAGDSMTFEARPDWKNHWRVGAHWAKHDAFQEIVFKKVPEVATRVAMLRTGQADIAEITPEVVREVERAKLNTVKSADSYVPMVTFHGVWMPSKPGYDASLPWIKKEVRQALSLALNRKEIGEKFYFGTASPAPGPH